jgi:hypothetical protein
MFVEMETIVETFMMGNVERLLSWKRELIQ